MGVFFHLKIEAELTTEICGLNAAESYSLVEKSCEYGNVPSDSIKGGEFLAQLSG
jgi:hypothetical protein